MLAIIALVVAAVVAVILFTTVLHLLFSPWLLVIAIAVVAAVKLRPRRSQR
jgi:hypothetical protein